MLSDMIQELEGGRLEVDSECCRAVATLQAATPVDTQSRRFNS